MHVINLELHPGWDHIRRWFQPRLNQDKSMNNVNAAVTRKDAYAQCLDQRKLVPYDRPRKLLGRIFCAHSSYADEPANPYSSPYLSPSSTEHKYWTFSSLCRRITCYLARYQTTTSNAAGSKSSKQPPAIAHWLRFALHYRVTKTLS